MSNVLSFYDPLETPRFHRIMFGLPGLRPCTDVGLTFIATARLLRTSRRRDTTVMITKSIEKKGRERKFSKINTTGTLAGYCDKRSFNGIISYFFFTRFTGQAEVELFEHINRGFLRIFNLRTNTNPFFRNRRKRAKIKQFRHVRLNTELSCSRYQSVPAKRSRYILYSSKKQKKNYQL